MARRCTTDACMTKATRRSANLDLSHAQVLDNPKRDWQRIASNGKRVARDLDVNWNEFTTDKYIFSHATIVSSARVEENGYYIDPVCTPLINSNGNAWSNTILQSTFRSFIGADNYFEHIQQPEMRKGKILDAVLRPVDYQNPNVDGTARVYFCDILVATNREHEQLCQKIASGEMGTLSMGCLAAHVTCSKCGKVMGDNDADCNHLSREILQDFTDENGIQRKTAELCGRIWKDSKGNWVGDENSVQFIEASWVEQPAFEGAVLNHIVSEPPKSASKVSELSTPKLQDTLDELLQTRVADSRGMMALRIAIEEMNRRKRQEMASRIAGRFWE